MRVKKREKKSTSSKLLGSRARKKIHKSYQSPLDYLQYRYVNFGQLSAK